MPEGQPTEEELQNMSPEQIAEMQKKNCVFCKIIAGEVPSHKVYGDDKMIALLDIYPAAKGHTLVLPKEHTPIMPLIKPEIFKHMFRNVKYLARGVKRGAPSGRCTIFIANGAAAGQQSPHFLFHIIPRDDDDGLNNLEVPSNDISQDDILESLKTNITKMMQAHLQKEGKVLVKPPSKNELAKILDDNPQLREMIMKNPDQLKLTIETNPQLKVLFQGTDIDKLSEKLKEVEIKDVSKKEKKEEEKAKEEKKEPPKEEKKEEKKEDRESLLDKVSKMFTK
ncbi:MAG: HIT domain-containing protein [Nanoarchaeota archaeon]|nr:HIT domain-containing protein [DPANN group archaeon]MBL7116431.1 HIT domain-containing protein [Nanoarchaeota archaeon]